MSDVIINAKVGVSGVNNGAVVVFAQETGTYSRFDPDVNQYVASGQLFNQYNNRFDEYYGANGSPTSSIVQTANAVIASGSATSATVDTYGNTLVGIHFPSAFTGATVSFQASPFLTGPYRTVNQFDSASDYLVTVSANEYQPVDFNVFAGIRYLRIVSASTETLDRTLNLSLKAM